MSIPEVSVNYTGAGRIEINFNPPIKYWRFPNNNGDEIISSLYKDITLEFVYRALEEKLKEEIKCFIISKLQNWESQGKVIFPLNTIKLEFEKW